jgi:hypothetical protein
MIGQRWRFSRRPANPAPANCGDLRSQLPEGFYDRPAKLIAELGAAWSKARAGYTAQPLIRTLGAEPVRVVIASTTAVSGG